MPAGGVCLEWFTSVSGFSLWVFVGGRLLMFGGDDLLVLVVDLGFCLVRVALLCV